MKKKIAKNTIYNIAKFFSYILATYIVMSFLDMTKENRAEGNFFLLLIKLMEMVAQ